MASATSILIFVLATLTWGGSNGPETVPGPELPDRVLIVFNATDLDRDGNGMVDSEQVARHYAARRGVPQGQLLGLSISTPYEFYSQPTGWTDFFDEVVLPLRAALSQIGTTNIDHILLCYGMPYVVDLTALGLGKRALDSLLADPYRLGDRLTPDLPAYWWSNAYFDGDPGYGTDLDRFHHGYHAGGQPMYLVSRLTGSSAAHANELVERALYAERYLAASVIAPGYHGTAYLDTRYGKYTDEQLTSGYPFDRMTYAEADKGIAYGRFLLEAAGLTVQWESTSNDKAIGESGAVFEGGAPAAVASSALFYSGWYNYGRYLDVYDWVPGAVAIDLNSNSARYLRESMPSAFLSSALERGLTGGAGAIAEPFVNGHPYPETIAYYLLAGYTFGEAAMASTPGLRWVTLAVGDPLYAPYRVGRTSENDVSPPPVPEIRLSGIGQARLVEACLTPATTPELVRGSLEYGQVAPGELFVPGSPAWRTRQTFAPTGLVLRKFYRYRVRLTDPGGNETATEPGLLYTGANQDADIEITVSPSVVSSAQSLEAEILIGGVPAVGNRVIGFDLRLSVPHLGLEDYDLMPYWPAMAPILQTSPDKQSLRMTVTIPPGLFSAGNYEIEARAFLRGGGLRSSMAVFTIE